MKKKLLIFIILFIITAVVVNLGYKAYLKYKHPPCEAMTGFKSIKGGKPLSNNFINKFKYVFVKLEADAMPSGKPVKYYIVNPDGTVLDNGEFDKDSHLKIDKKFPGAKGTWQIKFEAADSGEVISCTYVFASADVESAVLQRCRETLKTMK